MTRDLTPARMLLKCWEGVCDGDPTTVNLDPYPDPVGIWSIGYGHVVRDGHGQPIRGRAREADARAVYPHGITPDEALVLMDDDMRAPAAAILSLVKVPLSDAQFCALVSFTYNAGVANLRASTLLRRLNAGTYACVPAEMMKWVYATRGKVKIALDGLRNRRQAEAALWASGTATDATSIGTFTA